MEIDLDSLAQELGYLFRDPELPALALTHPSFDHERGQAGGGDYQRLEFLGDAVLGLVLAELLYARHPLRSEGDLSRLRSQLADQDSLAQIARLHRLGDFIRLGRGEEQSGGRDKDSILADVFEALVAAVYLDGGFGAARELVARLVAPRLEGQGEGLRQKDAKSELQELVSARRLPAPTYELVEEQGPPHDRLFRFQVRVRDEVVGEGGGRSKKQAQQAAAAQALARLQSDDRMDP